MDMHSFFRFTASRFFRYPVWTLAAFCFLLFPVSRPLHAQDERPASATDKFKSIENRLTQIEAQQKEIIETQQEILKKLDTLRVWVRRT